MQLLNTQTVKIGELEFPIKITNRAMIEYESISGHSISNMSNTQELIQFFYCTDKAGAKSTNTQFTYTYDEFLDVIDEYYVDVLTNFTKALIVESGGDEKKQKANK